MRVDLRWLQSVWPQRDVLLGGEARLEGRVWCRLSRRLRRAITALHLDVRRLQSVRPQRDAVRSGEWSDGWNELERDVRVLVPDRSPAAEAPLPLDVRRLQSVRKQCRAVCTLMPSDIVFQRERQVSCGILAAPR